ncbi:MAG TPA: TfpX/TfpZ family type IV pilin accessory protein [Steroidobacter sp.]|uniref:TfpX/TfpZ family type IV pilin accessory protein n=1 Tax=Steroidobacter sp. TaxID=1978227 RepID=UPI002ED87A23
MIVWREKFRAVLLHFMVTLVMALGAAGLIFLVWYPDPFQTMVGGTRFFLLICICDLVLGPLTSLIIYNSKKTRRALIFDYTVVGIVQLAAFVYGVVSIANARPVYVAWAKDRFEVVMAEDLDDEDLAAAQDPYRTRPKWGPVLIGTQRPSTSEERNDLLFAALERGKDIQNFPRYFVPYEQVTEQVKEASLPLDKLYKRRPEARAAIAAQHLNVPEEQLRWAPIHSPRMYWTVLVDGKSGELLCYLPVDPYDS